MKKSILLLVFFSLNTLLISSTLAQTTWERLFVNRSADAFRSVTEVPSGGYILAGYISDSTVNDTDFYVVRMNTLGDTLWTRSYNGPASRKDLLYRVINTSDGGFAFCGYSTSYGAGSDDAIWAKMDQNGNMQWVKYWGGAGKDRAQDIVQTSDGGYAITGYTTSPPAQYYDAFIIRTNSSGDTLWTRRYGSSAFDDANAIKQLPDKGFIIGGQSNNGANGLDNYLVRTNLNGDTLWTRKFGTVGTDNIEHIIRLADGSFVMTGGTDGPGFGGNDGVLTKTDSGGAVLWTKNFGGNSQDDFHQVEPTNDGGFILAGTTRSYELPNPTMWLVKTNSSGDSTWTRRHGGTNHDHGYSAMQTSDGGYIFAGYSGSYGFNYEDAYVIKTNSLGQIGNYLTYTSVYDVVSPANFSCGASSVPVSVQVYNFGRDTITSIPITVQITGALTQTLSQTWTGTLYPNDAFIYTFPTAINTTAGGVLNLNCYTSTNNEVIPTRNGIQTSRTILAYSSAPLAVDGARCGTGTVVIGATSPDSVFWYTASSGGTLLAYGPTFTTPVISNNTTYYAQAGFSCPSSRVAVQASVFNTPTAPTTTNAQRCGSGSLTLTASASDPIRWFDASSGGSQVGTGTTFVTPMLSSSYTYYAEAYNPGCGSTRIAAIATINPQSADPVTTSAGRCGSGSLTLTANATDPVTWYDAPAGGNIVGTGNSYNTPVISSTTSYWALADNGICPSNRVEAVANIYTQMPDPVVSPAARCGPGSLTLHASSLATLIWYPTSTGGTQLGFGSSFTTPSLSSTTTYYVLATDGQCTSNYIPVTATINPVPVIDLGPDVIVTALNYTIDAGPGFSSYDWNTGESTQSIIVDSTGNYCVTITDANSCTASDCIFVELLVGVQESLLLDQLAVYPNPGKGLFYFHTGSLKGNIQFNVFNASGQMIRSGNINTSVNGYVESLDLSDQPSGIYLIRFQEHNKNINRNIILQR